MYRARDKLVIELDPPSVTLHELCDLYGTYVTPDLVQKGKYSPKLVMTLLGHSQPDVAMQYYTRMIEEDYRSATFEPPIPATAGRTVNAKDADPVESAS